jgi:isoleucyl-tRNA synthetase
VLHDGPPYANGDLHIGHALNKILKDFINRYQSLKGRRVRFVPGWDCHGLPIELKVLQGLTPEARDALTPIKLRYKAKAFALKAVDAQREQFRRYGVWADWEAPYLTLQPEYEAAQIGVFGQMFLNGHIYRGKKPVNWSPSSGTALAEAELEYPEGHVSRAVYVAMPVRSLPPTFPAELREAASTASLAIWTTTPWTLPANAAIAVNGALRYSLVEAGPSATGAAAPKGAAVPTGGRYIVAQGLIATLEAKWGVSLRPLGDFTGAAIEHATYAHPLASRGAPFDRVCPLVVGGDYITTEAGTGLVHTAPGHGQDDYIVGMRCGLPLLSPVDDAGLFTAEAGAMLAGKAVLSDGNAAVVEALREEKGLLLEEAYGHKYPYDWRSKQPTIFRATEQWFASVEGFRDAALAAVSGVSWVPAVGEKRITPMVAGRADWCISRQRTWGVPIPVFYDTETGAPLMDAASIAHIQSVVAAQGSDAWWLLDTEALLPEQHRHLAPKLRRGTDTMDVWFDSGSSWAGVVAARPGLRLPADLYLEGSDQHRGWFQSSLLTSVAARGAAPYAAVLTHGFVLDEKGVKMSKSLGNVVDPRLVIEGGKDEKADPPLGADVLRLWVASVDYTSDVLVGPAILRQLSETYRKMRGTLRYLLGNLADFDPAQHAVPWAALPAADRVALRRLGALMAEVEEAYDVYAFSRAFAALNAFTTTFLSSFYLDCAKDRLYIRSVDAPSRRAAQTVLAAALRRMTAALAPLAPHMAEDAHRAAPPALAASLGGAASVFQAGWPSTPPEWLAPPAADASDDPALWDTLTALRGEVNKLLEAARNAKALGASLEAKVLIHVSDAALATRLAAFADRPGAPDGTDELRYILIVSAAQLMPSADAVLAAAASAGEGAAFSVAAAPLPGGATLAAAVLRAEGAKCERCWNFSALVSRDGRHPTLCERCVPVADAIGMAPAAELQAARAAAAAGAGA